MTNLEKAATDLIAEFDDLHSYLKHSVLGPHIDALRAALAQQAEPVAEPVAEPLIDTADTVFHRPSREWWTVAYVRGDKLSACGWPETIADRHDCLLVTKATPAERLDLLREMSKSTGNRAAYARDQLAQAEPVVGSVAEAWPTVDEFAQHIRWINGANKMGAAALAESLLEWLRAKQQAEPVAWGHLKQYGYAPGDYMSTCSHCKVISIMDKRAITCLGCARKLHERTQQTEPVAEPVALDKIKNTHTTITRFDFEQRPDHEYAGLPHRLYTQSSTDGCYLCACLAEIERLKQAEPVVDDGQEYGIDEDTGRVK